MPDLGAGIQNYFEGLQQERSRQAYLGQLQKQQNLKTAMEMLKASRTTQAKPIWDAKRGVIIDPNTGQVITPQGLPAAPPSGKGPDIYTRYAMHANGLADPSQVSNDQYMDAWNKVENFKSNLIAGRTPPQIIQETNPDPNTGLPVARAYRVPKRGGNATEIMTGAAAGGGTRPLTQEKLPTQITNQINAVNQAEAQVPGLEADFPSVSQKFNQNGPGWFYQQWLKYKAPASLLGRPDEDVADWFTKVGQTKGRLLMAAGGNSRNLKMVNDLYGAHVVAETQDPVQLMGRIRAFQNGGYFDAVRKSIGLAPQGTGPAGNSLADKGYVKLPNGMWYNPTTNKYDDGK